MVSLIFINAVPFYNTVYNIKVCHLLLYCDVLGVHNQNPTLIEGLVNSKWPMAISSPNIVQNQPEQSQSYSSLIGNSVWTMSCQGEVEVAWLTRHHQVI